MNAEIRCVVFDFDGLMFNTEELYQHVGGELLRFAISDEATELRRAVGVAVG